ncbi:3'-5' exonuclease [archaeon]|nr:3'-5' exonuclease [archaeon]
MKNLNLKRPIAVIDLETTGVDRQNDRIVEIGITKIFPDGKEEILDSLINPEIPIPSEATEIHGIKDTDVQGKPIFKEFAPKIISFIDNCDWCGFNLIGFDLYLLESEFKRAEINYSSEGRKVIDVMRIYHKLEPRDLSAAHLKYCEKTLENAHRVNADIKATIDVLESQLEKHKDLPRDVSELDEFCNPKDPSWIDSEGKIIWSNNEAVLNFSGHKGKTLEYMQKNEMGFLLWVMSKDFSSEVKMIVKNAIEGKFPKTD